MHEQDKTCNLECVKKGDVHEFVGPVKILLVDPPKAEYKRNRTQAALLSLTTMVIGANTFSTLLFCLSFKLPKFINSHILLCGFGYQFCMPFGILMLHSLYGPAVLLEKSERRIQHLLLQIFGLALSASGTALAIVLGEKSVHDPPKLYTSYHFYSGCIAAGFALLCCLIGPCLFCLKREQISSSCLTYMHRLCGILSFVASTVCYILGIYKPIMYLWFYILGYQMAPLYLVILFCTVSMVLVLIEPCSKFFPKRNKT